MKKNWKSRTLYKVLIPFLQIACITSTVVFALLACYCLSRGDMYRASHKSVVQESRAAVTKNNSMIAATHVADKSYGRSALTGTNFQYGVITGHNTDIDGYINKLSAGDLSDPKLYAYQNFKDLSKLDPKNTEEVTILHYPCNKGAHYEHYTNGPFSVGGIYLNSQTVKHTVEGFGLEMNSRSPYVRSDGIWYPLAENTAYETILKEKNKDQNIYSTSENGDDDGLLTRDEIGRMIKQHHYAKEDVVAFHRISYGDSDQYITVYPKDMKEFNATKLAASKISTQPASLDNLVSFSTESTDATEEAIVVSYVPKKLDMSLDDGYVKNLNFINFFFDHRYLFIVLSILSFLGFVVTTAMFICLAGHTVDPMPTSGEENIRKLSDGTYLQRWGIARMPMDLWCFFLLVFFGITGVWAEYTEPGYEHIMVSGVAYCIFGGLCAELLLYVLVVNLKLGNILKRTIIGRVIDALIHLKSGTEIKKKARSGFIIVTVLEFFAFLLMSSTSLGNLHSDVFGLLFVCWVALRVVVYIWLKKGTEILSQTLDQAVADRMKSERFQTQLITNVSHDIKTPLTSIISYVDLLSKESLDNEKAVEYVAVLSRQSARLKKLIQDLIDASKASSGNIPLHMQPVNSSVILSQAAGEYNERLSAAGIELQTFVQASTPEGDPDAANDLHGVYIQADPQQLWRVFNNLLSNISKYAQHSTRAYVDLEEQNGTVRFIFRNISADPLHVSAEELMERFVQGDTSRNTEGSGLGLSIAKSLTELMGGSFSIVVDGDLFKAIVEFPATAI